MSIRRQDILSAIKTRMQNISVANGYHSAMGVNVFVWRTSSLDPNVLPALIIRDMSQAKDQEGENAPYSFDTWRMQIEIEIVGQSGGTTDVSIRQMIADVYKAIGVDDTFGGVAITSFLLDDGIILNDQQSKVVGGATIHFEILYRTSKYQEN
jgi:hypothetical protein